MIKVFLLLLLPMALFADVTFYAFSEAEVDIFSDMLTSISFFFNTGVDTGDRYLSLIRFIILFGTLIVTVQMAAKINKTNTSSPTSSLVDFATYQVVVIGMLTVMFGHYENVIVKDERSGKVGVSAELPYVFAETMSFFSKFRWEMTDISEEVYADLRVPASSSWGILNYGMSGLGYGGVPSSMTEAMKMSFAVLDNEKTESDQKLSPQVDQLLTECIVTPLSANPSTAMMTTQLYYEKSIMDSLDDLFNVSQTQLRNIWLEKQYYPGLDTCGALWDNIKTEINKIKANATPETDILTKRMVGEFASSLSYVVSLSDRSTAGVSSANALIDDAANIQGALVQSMFAGQTKNIFQKLGVAGNLYSAAESQSLAEMQYQGIGTGVMMRKHLPVFAAVLFIIMAGAFPIMFAFAFLPGGWKILINFGKTLGWVTLWNPMSSILSFLLDRRLGDIYEKIDSSAFMATSGNYAELLTAANLASTSAEAAEISALAGYMFLSVPALSWLLISGSGYMLGSMTGVLGNAFAKNMATGNIVENAKTKEAANAASSISGKDVSMAEMAHFGAVKDSQMVGGEYAGTKGAMSNLGMTMSDFGHSSAGQASFATGKSLGTSGGMSVESASTGGAISGMKEASSIEGAAHGAEKAALGSGKSSINYAGESSFKNAAMAEMDQLRKGYKTKLSDFDSVNDLQTTQGAADLGAQASTVGDVTGKDIHERAHMNASDFRADNLKARGVNLGQYRTGSEGATQAKGTSTAASTIGGTRSAGNIASDAGELSESQSRVDQDNAASVRGQSSEFKEQVASKLSGSGLRGASATIATNNMYEKMHRTIASNHKRERDVAIDNAEAAATQIEGVQQELGQIREQLSNPSLIQEGYSDTRMSLYNRKEELEGQLSALQSGLATQKSIATGHNNASVEASRIANRISGAYSNETLGAVGSQRDVTASMNAHRMLASEAGVTGVAEIASESTVGTSVNKWNNIGAFSDGMNEMFGARSGPEQALLEKNNFGQSAVASYYALGGTNDLSMTTNLSGATSRTGYNVGTGEFTTNVTTAERGASFKMADGYNLMFDTTNSQHVQDLGGAKTTAAMAYVGNQAANMGVGMITRGAGNTMGGFARGAGGGKPSTPNMGETPIQ